MKRLVLLTSLLILLIIIQINAVIGAAPIGDVAYIYSSDQIAAESFESLLEKNDIPTDLIPLGNVARTNFSAYQVIIVGSDTGNWDNPKLVSAVNKSGRPIIGIGRGGSWLFERIGLFIDWGQCWITTTNQVYVLEPSHQIFTYPNIIPYDEFYIAFLGGVINLLISKHKELNAKTQRRKVLKRLCALAPLR